MNALLVFLLGLPVLVIAARDCSVDNGGCSQQCIDRNDGVEPTCGCECYYVLDGDAETCVPISACGVDILFMYDFTDAVDTNCAVIGFPPGALPGITYDQFEAWRDATAENVKVFEQEIADGSFRAGTMVSGASLSVTNDYGASTSADAMRAAILAITATSSEICGDDYVFRTAFYTFDNGDVAQNAIVAPTGGGDGTLTTRIAVISMATPLGDAVDADTLNTYATAIHSYYDQVFVIGRLSTAALNAIQQPRIDPQLRLLACQDNVSTSCSYLFYTDGVNDDSASFERETVEPMIDRNKCISRRTPYTYSATCENTEINITIPSCLLGGLLVSDLQLNDASCTGSTHSTTVGSEVIFTVQYADCLPTITYNTVDGVEFITYTQTVQTKDYGTGSNMKQLNLGASCVFPRYTDEQLGIVNPAVAELTGSVEETGSFPVDLVLYTDDTYTTPYASAVFPLTISVLDIMYFAIEATLPGNLKLIIKDVVATNNADKSLGDSHAILTDECIDDDTFSLLSAPTVAEVRFSLPMFEFSSTADEANGAKDPVYFHVTLRVCEISDNTAMCDQTCDGRKKRDVSEMDGPSETRTIGPFYPASPGISKPDEPSQIEKRQHLNSGEISSTQAKTEDKLESDVFHIYLVSPNAQMMCFWFVLLVATLLFVHFTLGCFLKPFSTEGSPRIPWRACKLPNGLDDGRKMNC